MQQKIVTHTAEECECKPPCYIVVKEEFEDEPLELELEEGTALF